jgi:hypothetical protein
MNAGSIAAFLADPDRPEAPDVLDSVAFETIRDQGVAPLLYRTLRDRRLLEAQPEAFQQWLVGTARDETLLEAIRHDETVRVIERLVGEGIHPLLFKGSALAYTCYPEPWLRPRLDTDLLIRPDDLRKATRAFESIGYARGMRTSGEHVTHQCTYTSTARGPLMAFDVHWKLADPQVFADLFSYDELAREAVEVPQLGPKAKALSDVHALIVACMHRVAHHYDREILILLYDIDLLARRLSSAEWVQVARVAAEKRICAVTARGLDLAVRLLRSPVPPNVTDALAHPSAFEPTAAYLRSDLRKIDVLMSDLRELKGWRQRLTLVREHLFPPPAFILRSYGKSQTLLLPLLYLHRVFSGAHGWFKTIR